MLAADPNKRFEAAQAVFKSRQAGALPALEAAQIVGDKVVRDIVEHWAERQVAIPHAAVLPEK